MPFRILFVEGQLTFGGECGDHAVPIKMMPCYMTMVRGRNCALFAILAPACSPAGSPDPLCSAFACRAVSNPFQGDYDNILLIRKLVRNVADAALCLVSSGSALNHASPSFL